MANRTEGVCDSASSHFLRLSSHSNVRLIYDGLVKNWGSGGVGWWLNESFGDLGLGQGAKKPHEGRAASVSTASSYPGGCIEDKTEACDPAH